MRERNPHLLVITVLGCLLVVSALGAGAVSDSLVVYGVAFLALLIVTASIVETLIRAFGVRPGTPSVGDGDDH